MTPSHYVMEIKDYVEDAMDLFEEEVVPGINTSKLWDVLHIIHKLASEGIKHDEPCEPR